MSYKEKNRPKKHRSRITEEIKWNQDPLAAARSRKRLIIAAKIADAIDQKDLKKSELADRLDKYSSEVTRWTSGDHNFTMDTLSDLEEILGVQLLATQKTNKTRVQHALACTLTIDVATTGDKMKSKEAFVHATKYIAQSGGMQATAIEVWSTPILE